MIITQEAQDKAIELQKERGLTHIIDYVQDLKSEQPSLHDQLQYVAIEISRVIYEVFFKLFGLLRFKRRWI